MDRARVKALKGAAWISLFQNEHEAARALLEESLALSRESEDEEGIATSLVYLGLVAVMGDQEDVPVQAILEEALRLKPKLEDRRAIGDLLVFEGLVAASRGDLARELDHKVIIQLSLLGLAAVAASQDLPARAARLWGVAEGMHEAYGVHLAPVARSRTNYDSYLAAARSRLDEAAFEEAWAEGKAMPPETAIEYALSEEEPAPPAATAPEVTPAGEPPGKLTRREEEVAALVARGLTNRRIASELTLSRRTVDNHVRNILKKLDLPSRSGVAARLEERRLRGADPD